MVGSYSDYDDKFETTQKSRVGGLNTYHKDLFNAHLRKYSPPAPSPYPPQVPYDNGIATIQGVLPAFGGVTLLAATCSTSRVSHRQKNYRNDMMMIMTTIMTMLMVIIIVVTSISLLILNPAIVPPEPTLP